MSDNWGNQQIPYSQEAEEAALGAALTNGAYAEDILAAAAPERYFILRNKYVAQAIEKCLERKLAVDLLIIIEILKEMNKLDEIGGPAYLTQLINACPASYNGAMYAQLVNRAAAKRDMLESADGWKAKILGGDQSVESLIAFAENAIQKVAESSPLDNVYSMRQMMHTVLDNMEARVAERGAGGSGLAGIPTGILGLDELINGFQKGKLYLIGGRPGMGKTSIIIFFAVCIARLPKPDGKPYVVYSWSGEMDEEEIGQRAVASKSNVNSKNLLNGNLTSAETSAITEAAGELGDMHIHVDTTVRMTPRKLRRNIRQWERANNLKVDVVMVDYAQLLHGDGKTGNRVEELESISRALKELARELKVPVISAVQLNRGVEVRDDKRPELSDMKGSGGFEQDADVVLFPFFEAYYGNKTMKSGYMELIVAKQRSGETGVVNLWADFARNSYVEDLQLKALG